MKTTKLHDKDLIPNVIIHVIILLSYLTIHSSNATINQTLSDQSIKQNIHKTKKPIVLFETSMGNFAMKLYPKKAPKTCENFLRYVNDNYYNNTLFHRVIDGFMIQGGGFKQGFTQKQTYIPIKNESKKGLPNLRGWVAMALTTNPNSATSQFFINVANNPHLNYSIKNRTGYTVFAKIIDGMSVIDQIKKVPTQRITIWSKLYKRYIPLYNVPKRDIIIYTAKQIQ